MGKDYFSDLNTSEEPRSARIPVRPDQEQHSQDENGSEKSIRNISVSPRRNAMTQRTTDARVPIRQPEISQPRRGRAQYTLWSAAAIITIAVGALTFALLTANTSVQITPRVHQVTFDPATQFTAYPLGDSLATGLTYTVQTLQFEDSATVPATGTEKAEERASGTITVYNAYSPTSVRLIKNTRFESPNGLVYRIPASVEVPGKKGSTPGEVTVTVFADQPGPQYNISPTDKFTVPGLKNTPDMYNGVYARSSSAFTGGFLGEKPAVAPAALEAARSEIRARLQGKVGDSIKAIQGGFAFAPLANITYESQPTIADPAGGAKVTERANVQLPVFPSDPFAKAIAQAVSADAADSAVTLRPLGELHAQSSGTSSNTLGASPLTFSLSGAAVVVWDVDPEAVKQALLGKEQAAFKPIVSTFIGIKDATAHIAPFWRSTFPTDIAKIEVTVSDPSQSQ